MLRLWKDFLQNLGIKCCKGLESANQNRNEFLSNTKNTYIHTSTQRIVWLLDRQETLIVKCINVAVQNFLRIRNDLSADYYVYINTR